MFENHEFECCRYVRTSSVRKTINTILCLKKILKKLKNVNEFLNVQINCYVHKK